MMDRSTEQLLSRYLDGVETPEEFAELERQALQSPELRRELVRLAKLDSMTRTLVKEAAAAKEFSKCGERIIATERRRWRIRWVCGAAAAALVVCVVGVNLWQARQAEKLTVAIGREGDAKPPIPVPAPHVPAEGRLVAVSGEVWVARSDGTGQSAASVGTEVRADETIVTATNASALFAYADGSTLRIYRASAVVLSRTDAGPGLDLRQGAVDADIRKQPEGRRLRVLGELMQAEIVGTEFRLMADPRGKWKCLGVRTGVVEVRRVADGQKVVLKAGNYAAVAPNWPYMLMDARVCPVWKEICRAMAGTEYP